MPPESKYAVDELPFHIAHWRSDASLSKCSYFLDRYLRAPREFSFNLFLTSSGVIDS